MRVIKDAVKKAIGISRWKKTEREIRGIENNYDGIVPAEDWLNVFKEWTYDMAFQFPESGAFVKAFFEADIKEVKRKEDLSFLSWQDPILICLERNDLTRIKELVKHYRTIGVKHMVMLDNGSTDGSLEWLKEQDDVDLYSVHQGYTTILREAWINRILSKYGYDRWYIVVDSDEFLTYKGMERRDISEIIEYCKERGFNTIRGILLDMYAKDEIFSQEDIINFREHCRYLDSDSYYEVPSRYFRVIKGGFRERVLRVDAVLTKYPLFYFEKGILEVSSHYRYPFYDQNLKVSCLFGILHYKFIDQKDVDKFRERVKKKNYADDSKQYKGYLAGYGLVHKEEIGYSGTVCYEGPETLEKISFIDNWDSHKEGGYNDANQISQIPLVSIIMSVYNEQNYIEEAISSIQEQTEQNFEIIIFDDCSNDETANILKKMAEADKRIRLYELKTNRGLTFNLNLALSKARGKYIARMDGDDVCYPKRLEKEISFMERNPDIILCSCFMQTFGMSDIIGLSSYTKHEMIRCRMLLNAVLVHPGFMFRSELYHNLGFKYDETFREAQDYDFAARVACYYKVGIYKEVLVKKRTHEKAISSASHESQFKNADRVREGLLNQLNVQLNTEERNVYRKLATEEKAYSLDEYKTAVRIVERIILSNKTMKIYRQKVLREVMYRSVIHWILHNERGRAFGIILWLRKPYLYYFLKELSCWLWIQKEKQGIKNCKTSIDRKETDGKKG